MAFFENVYQSAAELAAANRVVPLGDIWIEADTGRAKRGTGGRRWNSLPYWEPFDAIQAGHQPVNVARYGTSKDHVRRALDAAEARGKGTVVYFPAGVYDFGPGLSLDGYSVQLRGDGACGKVATPTGTIFKASSQDGPVLDFTGWDTPGSFMGRVTHGGFRVIGSGQADASKNNAGVRLTSMSSANFVDIAVRDTGGPCWEHASNPGNGVYLCDFERIILSPPVSAKANDVPWMVMDESNGNRFRSFGLRSELSSGDVGASGAIILRGNATYTPHDNLFDGWWVEFLHPPTDGTLFHFEANATIIRDFQFFDVSKESGATGTSYFRFAAPAVNNYGGSELSGVIPGRDSGLATSIDMGVDMRQSRNLVHGVKGYKGTNVVISSNVANTTVILGGAYSAATDPAVVDNSGLFNNVCIDYVMRTEQIGQILRTGGAGSPEGVVMARAGSQYLRTDGGAGTTLYVKESGTGNTGWVAK